MNEKLVKMIVKGALGLTVSAVIGYMIKAEKEIEKRIDDYYDEDSKQED